MSNPRIAQLEQENADLASRLDETLQHLMELTMGDENEDFLDEDGGPDEDGGDGVIHGHPDVDPDAIPQVLSDGSFIIGDTLFIR